MPPMGSNPISAAKVGNSWFMQTVSWTRHKNSTHAMNAGDFTATLNGTPDSATAATGSSLAADGSYP